MTKHLRFLFVMLLAMIWSAGWAAVGDNFKLVTDAKDLKAGDKIIIGSKASNVVLGADNGSNKRTAVSATFSSDGVVAWKEGFDVITLEGTASAWYLHSEAGYLYVAAKKTDLKTASDLASVTNNAAVAVITITNNNASISFTTSESGRYIYYNTDTKVFGHYKKVNTTTSQIYKLVDSGDTKTATKISFDTEKTEFSVEKNSEASFTAPTATVKDADGKVVEGAKITYTSSNSNIASVAENGKVTFGSEFGTATITASYAGDATYKPAASNYTIIYSKIPTFMAWSESVVNVNLGETFTAPTLTFTAHGVNLEDKTIQYNSSDENVAMIDETGYVLPMEKAGSTTITATFAGDDTHEAASAEYTLNVIDPNKTDVTFDFTDPEKYGYSKPASNKSTDLSNGDKLESNEVTITSVQGGTKTKTRFFNSKNVILLRIYTGAILTVNAPAGFAINRIDFTDDSSSPVKNFTFSTGELNSKTWTGLAKNLTMKVDNNSVFLKNMTVNLVKLVELDENSESNTIEAKKGVNVTLKRSMVANEWNTICLPFDVSKEKAQTAFGEGVKIAQLDDKNSTGNTLKFVNMTDYGMQATVPYLIKPSKENTSNEYVFENVNVVADDINKKYETTEGYLVFKGIYNMMDITKDVVDNVDATYYAAFLGADNKIYKANGSGNKTKGFRAYFAIPKDAAASALRVVIDGTATSIKNIDSEVVESNAPVYNLQGQRVDGNNLTPGIYVKAGKKFVVK